MIQFPIQSAIPDPIEAIPETNIYYVIAIAFYDEVYVEQATSYVHAITIATGMLEINEDYPDDKDDVYISQA